MNRPIKLMHWIIKRDKFDMQYKLLENGASRKHQSSSNIAGRSFKFTNALHQTSVVVISSQVSMFGG